MPDPNCTAGFHGTPWAYQQHHCRCPEAVKAMRAEWARHRKPYKPTGRKRGWSNLRDVDEVAVALVVNDGHQMNLTAGERRAAIAALVERGWPTCRIADRLGVTTRTVARHKQAA